MLIADTTNEVRHVSMHLPKIAYHRIEGCPYHFKVWYKWSWHVKNSASNQQICSDQSGCLATLYFSLCIIWCMCRRLMWLMLGAVKYHIFRGDSHDRNTRVKHGPGNSKPPFFAVHICRWPRKFDDNLLAKMDHAEGHEASSFAPPHTVRQMRWLNG